MDLRGRFPASGGSVRERNLIRRTCCSSSTADATDGSHSQRVAGQRLIFRLIGAHRLTSGVSPESPVATTLRAASTLCAHRHRSAVLEYVPPCNHPNGAA